MRQHSELMQEQIDEEGQIIEMIMESMIRAMEARIAMQNSAQANLESASDNLLGVQ